MNTTWKSRFQHWTTVRAKTREEQRRGHLLSLFLLIIIALGIVTVSQDAWNWLVHGNLVAGRFALISLLMVGISVGMWELNRRGHTTLIAHSLLSLAIITTSALSEMAFLDAVFIAYAIPVIMAGFVLPPQWSFPYAILVALGYILRYQFADVSIPVYSDKQIATLVGLAAVNYLIASRYDGALKRAEESEDRYRKLINSAHDVIFTIDRDGRFTSLNPSFETFTGWPREEWLGRSSGELIAEDDRPRALDYFDRVLQSGILRAIRLRVPNRVGEMLIFELNVSPQFKEGHVVGLLGIARDMTQEQRAQEALEASEKRFRALIEKSSDGIGLLSADGRITYASPALTNILGYTPDELIGRSAFELLHPDDVQSVAALFAQLLQSPSTSVTAQYRYLHKDGSWRWVEGTGTNLLAEPHVRAIVANYRDITESKRAQEALRESEQRFSIMFEKAPFAATLSSLPDGAFVNVNEAFEKMFGYTKQDAIGKTAVQLGINPDAEARARILTELQTNGSMRDLELMLRMKSGVAGVFLVNINIVDISGQKYILQTAQDITERKQIEEALRESEARKTAILESALDAFITIDSQGMVNEWNPQSQVIFGWSRDEAIGQKLADLIIPEGLRDAHVQGLQRFLATGEGPVIEKRIEITGLHRAGHTFPVELTITPVPTEAGLIFSAFVRDITERKQAAEKLERQNQRLKALREIDTAILSADSVESIVGAALSHIRELIDCRRASLALIDWGTNEGLIFDVRTISETIMPKGTRVPMALFQDMNQTLSKKQMVLINDLTALPSLPPLFQTGIQQGLRSVCVLPLFSQDNLIGSFNMSSEAPDFFDEEKIALGREVANQVAIAIQSASLFEAEHRHRQEAAALAEVSRDISATLQLDIVLERIVSYAKDLLDVETSAVYLAEPTSPILRASAAIGPDAEEIKNDLLQVGEGILGNIAMQKWGEIVNNTALDPRAITIKGTEDTALEHLMGVPVFSEDKLTGLIAVWRYGIGQEFKSTELDFLNSLAGQVAVAIKNARLYEEARQRADEFAILYETTRDFVARQNLTDVLETIVLGAMRLLHTAGGGIYLYDAARRDLYTAIDKGPGEIAGIRMQLGEGGVGRVAQTRQALIVNDYQGWEGRSPQYTDAPIGAILEVPMLYGDLLIGVLVVSEPDQAKREFTEAEARLLTLFAAPAALVIENARLFEETRKRLREMEAVNEANTAITRTLELEPMLENILQAAIHAIPAAERGSVLLADEQGNFHIRAVWGYADPRVRTFSFPPHSGYAALSFREQRAIIIPDVRADAAIRYNGDIQEMLTNKSAMAAPLVVKDRPIGVIAIDTSKREDAFNEGDLYLLRTIASSTALAIENAQLFENTRQRLADLEVLQTVASALRSAQTLDEMLPLLLDEILNALKTGTGSIWLYDAADQRLHPVETRGWLDQIGQMPMRPGEGIGGRVFATSQPYVAREFRRDPLGRVPVRDEVPANWGGTVIPIRTAQEAIGVMYIAAELPREIIENEVHLLITLAEIAGNAIHRTRLHERTEHLLEDLQASNVELTRAYDTTLEGWAKALELRDRETEGHTRRVTELTLRLARYMGVSEEELVNIHRGVLLHDIGKMGVSDDILKKTGKLTDSEWVEMRQHPQYAYDMLSPIAYLRGAIDIPYCHHEHWDGSGYPRGLKGGAIPRAARIFTVVDVWDALSHDRPYRTAWSSEKIIEYMLEHSGKLFDPAIVEIFLKMMSEGDRSESRLSAE